MSKLFADKVALVTGAARGIGAATAQMFAEEGAAVVLSDIGEGVEDLAAEFEAQGYRASALVGDVTDPHASESLVALAVERYGRIDFAFNNAGIGGNQVPIEELAIEDWRRVIDVNLNGVFYGTKYQVPAMIKTGGGVIVNTSSVLGLKPIPHHSLEYTAAKHGVVGLTRQLAVNYGGQGIRCVAVCPGFIETPLTMDDGEENVGEEGVGWFVNRTPLGRTGQPEDIAGAVKLLCSDEAAFINGACLEVDGGFVLT